MSNEYESLDDFIERKMNDFKFNLDSKLHTAKMGDPAKILDDNKKNLIGRIGKEYHDTRNNDIERDEDLRRVTLDSFNRSSFQSSYKLNIVNNDGSPASEQVITKGYKYTDLEGNIACKVVVEKKNNINWITEFFVDKQYMGYGLAKDLIEVAKNSLGADHARIPNGDIMQIVILRKRGFERIGQNKNHILMKYRPKGENDAHILAEEDTAKIPGAPINQLSQDTAKNNDSNFKNDTNLIKPGSTRKTVQNRKSMHKDTRNQNQNYTSTKLDQDVGNTNRDNDDNNFWKQEPDRGTIAH